MPEDTLDSIKTDMLFGDFIVKYRELLVFPKNNQ